MSPTAGIALMMNNYFHDVATALLAASAIALWVLLRRFEAGPRGPDAARYFLEVQRSMAKLARVALAWIVLGGIPRTIWYVQFEWNHFADRGQVPALIVKHVIAFAFVVYGVVFWRRLRARVRAVEAELRGGAVEPGDRAPRAFA